MKKGRVLGRVISFSLALILIFTTVIPSQTYANELSEYELSENSVFLEDGEHADDCMHLTEEFEDESQFFDDDVVIIGDDSPFVNSDIEADESEAEGETESAESELGLETLEEIILEDEAIEEDVSYELIEKLPGDEAVLDNGREEADSDSDSSFDVSTIQKDAEGYYKIETYEQFININKIVEPGYTNSVKVRIYADIEQKDILNDNKLEIGFKKVLLDLNGHTVSRNTYGIDYALIAMNTSGGELTIEDSVGGGKLYFYNAATTVSEPGVIYCNDGELIIKGGTIEIKGGSNGGAIFQGSRGKVSIYGGTIKSDNYAIRSFITNGVTSSRLCIYGGDFYSSSYSRLYATYGTYYPVGAQAYIFGGNFHSDKKYNGGHVSFDNSRADIVYAGGTFSQRLKVSSGGNSFDVNGVIDHFDIDSYEKDTEDGYERIKIALPPTISIGEGLTREDYLFRMARRIVGTYYDTTIDSHDVARKEGYKEAFTNYTYDYLDYPGVSVTYYSYSKKTSLITLNDLIEGSDDIDKIVWKKSYDGENYEVVESAKGKTSWKPEYESGEKVYYKAEVTRFYASGAGVKSRIEEANCYVRYEATKLLNGNAYILSDPAYNQTVSIAFNGDEEFMQLYNEGKLTYTWKYANDSETFNYTLKDGLNSDYAKVNGRSLTPKIGLVGKYVRLEVSAKDLGYANTIVTEAKQVGQAPNNNIPKLPVVVGVTDTSIRIKKASSYQVYLLYEKTKLDGKDFNTLDWTKSFKINSGEYVLTEESDGTTLSANKVYCLVTREYARDGRAASEAMALTMTTKGADSLNKDNMLLNGVSSGGTIYLDYDEYENVDGYVELEISTDPSGNYIWDEHTWSVSDYVGTDISVGGENKKVNAATGEGKIYPQTVSFTLKEMDSGSTSVQYGYIWASSSSEAEKYGKWSLRVYRSSTVSLSNLVPTFYEDGKEINSSSKTNITVNEQSTVSPFEKITMIPSSDRYQIRWYGVTNQSGTIVKNATNEYFTVDMNTGAITGVKNNSSIYNGVPQHRVAAYVYDTVTKTEKDANLSFLVKVIDRKHINVKEIILDTKEAVMLKNDTLTVGAVLSPSGATGTLYWSSDNTSVATVDTSGKITAVAPGDAVITAKVYSSTEVTSTVTVHVHGLLEVPAVESTCHTTGNDKYYKCSVCNKVFSSTTLESAAGSESDFVTPTKAHSFDTGTVTKAATCAEEGETVYKCTYSGCDKTISFAIEKIAHSYSSTWSKNSEKHWKECSCGAKKDEANHTWDAGKVTKEATYKATGVKTYTCTACGATKTEDIAKLTCSSHAWDAGKVTKEATTEAVGERVYTCTNCGKTKSEEIPKLKAEACKTHTWDSGKVTKEATAKETGIKLYTCTVCGTTKTEEIAKLECKDHTWDTGKVTKEATTEAVGERVYTCTNCGKTKSEEIPKLKAEACKTHTWDAGKVTTEATVKAPGVKLYTCTVCGATKTEEIAKLECKDHTWDAGKVTKKATSTKTGVKTYTCTTCGKTKTEKIPKKIVKGSVIKDSNGNQFEVLDTSKKTVSLKAPAKTTAKSYTIKSTVKINNVTYKITKISDKAFSKCSKATKITIGDNVTTIGKSAFAGLKKLTTVKFGKKVTSIGTSAFKGCVALKTITLSTTLKKIGDSAFSGCTAITKLTLPATLTSIGKSAFYGCTGITKLTIPSKVTSIGSSAFSGCKKLKTIKLSASLTTIGEKAFYKCTALTAITLPSKCTKIGANAFNGCTKLATITISSKKLTDKTVTANAFKGLKKTTVVKAPKGCVKSYKTLLKKKGFTGTVK